MIAARNGEPILIKPITYFVALYIALSCWALASLWRHNPGLIRGIMWSGIIIALPLLGALFYAGLFSPPPPLPPNERVGVHRYVAMGGQRIMNDDHGVESSGFTAPWFKRKERKAVRDSGGRGKREEGEE